MPICLNPLKAKFMQRLTGAYAPAAIATVTTLSCISKDAVNCAYYVHQSLNNKRIPDDKRNFVAGLDLANGILNVVVQSVAAFWFTKNINKIFDKKLAPKWFPEKMADNFVIKHGMEPQTAKNVVNSLKKGVKSGLLAFSALAITQIICKR